MASPAQNTCRSNKAPHDSCTAQRVQANRGEAERPCKPGARAKSWRAKQLLLPAPRPPAQNQPPPHTSASTYPSSQPTLPHAAGGPHIPQTQLDQVARQGRCPRTPVTEPPSKHKKGWAPSSGAPPSLRRQHPQRSKCVQSLPEPPDGAPSNHICQSRPHTCAAVSYTHLTLPTIYSV